MDKNILKITVVIPTYNRSKDLEECIKSIKNQSMLPSEIVVVDDCSSDDTENICIKYSTTYIRNSKRMGQSYGKNLGIKKSETDLVAFIDDDCIADKNWLKNLAKAMTLKEKIGIVGGRIVGLSGDMDKVSKKRRKSRIFRILLRFFYLKSNNVGKIYINGFTDSNFDRKDYEGEVDWVSAGNMLLNKKMVNTLFDENLKGNCRFEEPDFCLRAKDMEGIKVIYTPKALVHHKFSCISRMGIFDDLYFRKRNQMYFILKNKLPFLSSFAFISFILSQILDTCIFMILSVKNRGYFNAILGKIDGFKDYKKLKSLRFDALKNKEVKNR